MGVFQQTVELKTEQTFCSVLQDHDRSELKNGDARAFFGLIQDFFEAPGLEGIRLTAKCGLWRGDTGKWAKGSSF